MQYLAQRYGSWAWLHLELPLTTDGPEWALSAYGLLDGTVAPELGLETAEDGRPVLEEWGTLIHAETGEGPSRRRWTGIVTYSQLEGKAWRVKVIEWPGYLKGVPLETLIRGVKTDPADLLRQVWQDVQAWPSSWLGVTVVGKTPVTLGTDSDNKVAIAHATLVARQQTLDSLSKTKTEKTAALQDVTVTLADEVAAARTQVAAAQQSVNVLVAAGAPQGQVDLARATVTSRQDTLQAVVTAFNAETAAGKAALAAARGDQESARAAVEVAKTAYDVARERAKEDGGAYEIRPEDLTDAYRAVSDLCQVAGMEWTTSTVASNSAPDLRVQVHYPSAGRVRDDLVFEQGVNIVSELHLTRDGEDYANAGIGVGAGEGDAAIRRSIAPTSPRLRRPAVVEDRSVQRPDQLDSIVRTELRRRAGTPYVDEIEVVASDLAPMGSWAVGDHIRVSGRVPHFGDYSELHRIVSWQMVSDYRASIRLRLSATY